MRDVELVQKELSQLTGIKARFGQAVPPILWEYIGKATATVKLHDRERRPYGIDSLTVEIKWIQPAEPVPHYLTPKIGEVIRTNLTRNEDPSLAQVASQYPLPVGTGVSIELWHNKEPIEIADVSYQPTYWIKKITILDKEIGPVITTPIEDERLRDLERQISEAEAKLAELKRLIAELEAKVGWTAEEEAERARLQGIIDEETANVAKAQAEVDRLTEEVNKTQGRIDAVKEVWRKASECHRLIETGASLDQRYACAKSLADMVEEVFPESPFPDRLRSDNWFIVAITIGMVIALCKATTDSLEKQKADLQAQLSAARDSLEAAKRRLWDAKAAKERYELAITRAIALRQAEVNAAKARYELELRTLDNLKATYDTLLKEIEAARTQAIAEAARQREEVIKAKEEERESIAEEQRRIAEEYEKLAAESVGVEREEYLDKMRRALDIAKDAEEAAIAAALEREATAKEIATKKAELAQIELELEELRKELAITGERKEEAEKKVAGLPAIPKWGWVALGIGGTVLTATGIGYALKKKKKRK